MRASGSGRRADDVEDIPVVTCQMKFCWQFFTNCRWRLNNLAPSPLRYLSDLSSSASSLLLMTFSTMTYITTTAPTSPLFTLRRSPCNSLFTPSPFSSPAAYQPSTPPRTPKNLNTFVAPSVHSIIFNPSFVSRIPVWSAFATYAATLTTFNKLIGMLSPKIWRTNLNSYTSSRRG